MLTLAIKTINAVISITKNSLIKRNKEIHAVQIVTNDDGVNLRAIYISYYLHSDECK